MSNKVTVLVVIVSCAVSAAVFLVGNALLATRGDHAAANRSGRPILMDAKTGMFEYDWDPGDPDQSTEACIRYQLRIAAFESRIDYKTDKEISETVKLVAEECAAIKARAGKLRTIAAKYK